MATAFTADLFADDDTLPAGRPATERDGLGFEIGWDYAHYRLTPPPDALADAHPVHQGWRAGAAAFGNRTLKPTPHVRKWLQLRLSAWRRSRVFEGTQVTPNFLAQIDVPSCPVTRVALTHASGAGSDASVDRVCNRAGYAAGNLAVMSTRANAAKADLSCGDALTVVKQLEASGLDTLDGLDTVQWSRLAVLMSFILGAFSALGSGLGFVVAIPVIVGSVAITFLEILVALLQAFIFTFLTALFIGMSVVFEHDEHPAAEAH